METETQKLDREIAEIEADQKQAFDEAEPQVKALAKFLNEDDVSEIEEGSCDHYGYGRQEYLVLTDEEADARALEYTKDTLEECYLSEVPEMARQYVDLDRWAQDAVDSDGRGIVLASYDHEENEVKIDGVYYFIYRVS